MTAPEEEAEARSKNDGFGLIGFTGLIGLMGSMGLIGFRGFRGFIGFIGLIGFIGFIGFRGFRGFIGFIGCLGCRIFSGQEALVSQRPASGCTTGPDEAPGDRAAAWPEGFD